MLKAWLQWKPDEGVSMKAAGNRVHSVLIVQSWGQRAVRKPMSRMPAVGSWQRMSDGTTSYIMAPNQEENLQKNFTIKILALACIRFRTR